MTTPATLMHLSRTSIRNHLRSVRKHTSIISAIRQFPIPTSLIEFLQLSEYQDDNQPDDCIRTYELSEQLYFAMPRKRRRAQRHPYIQFWLTSCGFNKQSRQFRVVWQKRQWVWGGTADQKFNSQKQSSVSHPIKLRNFSNKSWLWDKTSALHGAILAQKLHKIKSQVECLYQTREWDIAVWPYISPFTSQTRFSEQVIVRCEEQTVMLNIFYNSQKNVFVVYP